MKKLKSQQRFIWYHQMHVFLIHLFCVIINISNIYCLNKNKNKTNKRRVKIKNLNIYLLPCRSPYARAVVGGKISHVACRIDPCPVN